MTVVLYTLCWNDGPRLEFFFRHYDKFVSRYVIYDDDSDEPTLNLLRRHPNVEIRRLERSDPDSFVLSEQSISNSCWKECRGESDWRSARPTREAGHAELELKAHFRPYGLPALQWIGISS